MTPLNKKKTFNGSNRVIPQIFCTALGTRLIQGSMFRKDKSIEKQNKQQQQKFNKDNSRTKLSLQLN